VHTRLPIALRKGHSTLPLYLAHVYNVATVAYLSYC